MYCDPSTCKDGDYRAVNNVPDGPKRLRRRRTKIATLDEKGRIPREINDGV